MTSTAAPPPSPVDIATPTTTPPSNRRRRLRSPALFQDDDDAHGSIKSSFLPSPLRVSSVSAAPLHELLLLSSPPSRRKVRSSRGNAGPSPRNSRRSRRRLDKDHTLLAFEEEATAADTNPKLRKKRQSRPKKEKLTLTVPAPPPTPSQETIYEVGVEFDGVWEQIQELILWKNAAKSALLFGFGSLTFLSSWFSKDFNFSIVSAASHLSILILAMSFFYDSFPNRHKQNLRKEVHLTEDDIVRVARIMLPMANTALAVARKIFSGEPVMTLKVAPVLLFAAKYGHLITVWRLLATGFFLSFTIPKLYYSYSNQFHARVESMQGIVSEAWRSCPHKRIVAISAATLCWNSFSVKARVFAVFLSLVILRYIHQQHIVDTGGEDENDQAMVIAKQKPAAE